MGVLVDVSRRNRQPEVMDQPGLQEVDHRQALNALNRVNWLSGSARIVWPSIRKLARELGRPVRVLDVASGGGDVPLALWRKAKRAGVPVRIEGCDFSPYACQHATERAQRAGADVRFFAFDALGSPLPSGYDVIMCSLFLHHLDEPQAVALLRAMSQAAAHLVLINDLRRSRIGYVLAHVVARIVTRCEVVHIDGPLSVAGAFTIPEVEQIAQQASLRGAIVARKWPQRFLLSWSRP